MTTPPPLKTYLVIGSATNPHGARITFRLTVKVPVATQERETENAQIQITRDLNEARYTGVTVTQIEAQ